MWSVADESEHDRRPRLSNLINGFFCSVAVIGVQGAWAVQIGNVSTTLRQLGMPMSQISYIWLAGPVTGIIVQPFIGIASDLHIFRWGRRRPFIVIGAFTTIIGLLGFGFVTSIHRKETALALACVFFWVLDAAINCMQAPLRMLLVDGVDRHKLDYGNACFAFNNGIGKAIGYLLGGVCLGASKPFTYFATEASAMFTLMAFMVLITTAITVFVVDEKMDQFPTTERKRKIGEVLRTGLNDLCITWKILPSVFWWAFIIQCAAYFAWFSTFIWVAIWMGDTVYGGTPNHNDIIDGCSIASPYVNGVHMANWGFCAMAVISYLWAPFLPKLCLKFGLKWVWVVHLIVLSGLLCSTPAVKEGQKYFGFALIALLGFPLAATFALPWQIATTVCSGDDDVCERGKTTTIFNFCQCFPEIIIGLVASPIVSLSGLPSAGLVLGGAGALVGAALCAKFLIPDDIHSYKLTREYIVNEE
eukprot:504468_1